MVKIILRQGITKAFKKESNHARRTIRITIKNKNNNSPKNYSNSIINNIAKYTATPFIYGCNDVY